VRPSFDFMFFTRYQAELEYCLGQAAELLGGPAHPLHLEWDLEKSLEKALVLEARRGLGREPAVLWLDRSKRGHQLYIGLARFRWPTPEGPVRLVRVVLPSEGCPLEGFWAVAEKDYRRFYRCVRRHIRSGEGEPPPILALADLDRLWNNTIGFLRRSRAAVRYGVVPKRGVLLLGEPGNGKTMACRWLAGQCRQSGLDWRNVTFQMYEHARQEGNLARLFWLDSPGIVLFDDFDAALRDREEAGQSELSTTFLGELDGVERKKGVVYLFTSNAQVAELDKAMRRPGRIDVILHFGYPDASLRRRLVRERWHPELVLAIDVEQLVAQTEDFSFAELEEVKNLLVLRHLDSGSWDWPWVRDAMELGRDARHASATIGFLPRLNGHASCLTPA